MALTELNQQAPAKRFCGAGEWILATESAGQDAERQLDLAKLQRRTLLQPGQFPAAVAISHGDDLTHWEPVLIPLQDGLRLWGESSIIVSGNEILNIARHGAPLGSGR